MSECENCDGTGWYLTPPLECRDGKYRKTRWKCSCGGKTMAFETTICQECPTPIQWPGLRAAYLRCINIALDARDSMLAERDTTIDRLTRENEDLRAKLEEAVMLAGSYRNRKRSRNRNAQFIAERLAKNLPADVAGFRVEVSIVCALPAETLAEMPPDRVVEVGQSEKRKTKSEHEDGTGEVGG